MEPTSPLAGLLTGLLDGTIVVLMVLAVALLVSRRNQQARVPVRVDERPGGATPAPVDLHRAA